VLQRSLWSNHVTTADDDVAIRSLTARFADAVNRAATSELAGLWTADGVWELPLGSIEGPDAIAAELSRLLAHHQRLVQLLAGGEILVVGDNASARWYLTELALGVDGVTRSFAGCYQDEIVRTPDGWRFARRRYQPVLRASGELEASSVDWPGALPLQAPGQHL
jgi:hypothetical protein